MTPSPYYSDEQTTLLLGDCFHVLTDLPDASVDAIVTDPPYGLGFMGKEWDSPGSFVERWPAESDTFGHVGGNHHPSNPADSTRTRRAEGIRFGRWCERWTAECLRVLKPGGHLIAFGGTRTYHRLACAIEDAGFEIRDSLHWVYGSGFPKGQNIGRSIDRRRDDRSQILRVTAWLATARDAAGWTNTMLDEAFEQTDCHHWTTQGISAAVPSTTQWGRLRDLLGFDDAEILPLVTRLNGRKGSVDEARSEREVVEQGVRVRKVSDVQVAALSSADSATAARAWAGWNTQLKPAHEPIILARKMTGFYSTVANVLLRGTGALNVDGCRVGSTSPGPGTTPASSVKECRRSMGGALNCVPNDGAAGRWPTNFLLGHGPECAGESCQLGCPVAEMDRQSGALKSGANPTRRRADKFREVYGDFTGQAECTPARGADSGGASRFFPVFRYAAKASASERPRLLDGTVHPTVKPLSLMRWLVRLVTPPGGTVLDPFAGTGTTLEAAVAEGFLAVGIEQHQPYADLAVQRLSKTLTLPLFGEMS